MASLNVSPFPKRPGFGKSGRPVQVRANFFEVTRLPDSKIVHYDVTITPDVPPTLNRHIFKLFEEMYRGSQLGGAYVVYDGRKNIFSPRPLPFGDTMSVQVTLPEEDGRQSKKAPRVFNVKMVKVATVNLAELGSFLKGKVAINANCLTGIMVLDVLIRHKPSITYSALRSSFYVPDGKQPLSDGVEVWPGYSQSVRPGQGHMYVNVDVSAGAYIQEGPLLDVFLKVIGRRTPDDLRRGLSSKDIDRANRTLKKASIVINHRGQGRKKYKINGFTTDGADRIMFEQTEGGPKTSVADYFQKRYNRRLAYPFLPCVQVRKTDCIPIEVCEVLPGQRFNRKLNEKQTADMIKFTCQNPSMRANKIMQGIQLLGYRENEYLRDFGMSVSEKMTTVNARVLDPPTINYHPTSREKTICPVDGAWNLRNRKVAQGATLKSWSVLVFNREADLNQRAVKNFVRELANTCHDTGMNIANRDPPVLYGNPNGNIENELKRAWVNAGNAVKSMPQVVVCILPNQGVPLYARIKRVSDTVIGVPTQCIQSKHVYTPKKQYCANVCLKINVKLGGMNSFLSPDQLPFISAEPTIILGADVNHPGPGDNSRPSIASVVGSMDAKAARYASCVRMQSSRTEIIANLGDMVRFMLRAFYKSCGQKPGRLLFYRDGVSEGQFAEVMKSEVDAVVKACSSIEAGYRPKITFVVIQKRHHARFFPIDRNHADRSGNCRAGTLVEGTITHPTEFDFYLQSHAGLQGTCRATHYHVLYDENSFTADSLQELSYRLCYLYARCTRSVSVVPPAYYAHLMCFRARFHTKSEDTLDDSASLDTSMDTDKVVSSYAPVKESLDKVMYFM